MGPFEIVKMINGTWNVRDGRSGAWVPDGIWLSKPAATYMAEALNEQAAIRQEET